jgi:hypothetical protein
MTRFPIAAFDRRGAVGLLAAMMFGSLLTIGALVLNQAHLHYRGLLQRQTTQAAALAGAAKLATFYTAGNSTAIVTAAQTIATANMPVATYGTIVPTSAVTLGQWNAATGVFTALGGTNLNPNPDAVRIQGLSTVANGNPVTTLMSGMIGTSTRQYTTTAIASFGTGQTWNTIITNDLSGSFANSISHQRAADKAILDCVRTAAGSASQFGITTHTGVSAIFQPLSQASVNFATLSTKIDTLRSCGNTGAPACSGSNVASAIYSARMQFANAAYNGTRKNIVIITDGVPNGVNRTYTREDGIFPNDTTTTPTCTRNCTDAQTWTMAVNQASLARAAGISISTIYYSGNTTNASQRTTYANQLAALTGGTGVAMVAPTQNQIAGVFAGFCSTMSSALKAVY